MLRVASCRKDAASCGSFACCAGMVPACVMRRAVRRAACGVRAVAGCFCCIYFIALCALHVASRVRDAVVVRERRCILRSCAECRWCATHVKQQRDVRGCGDLRYLHRGTCGMGRLIGSAAEWGGGAQKGGVVAMYGGSVRFKGGSIVRSSAVRGPRCRQLCVSHRAALGCLVRCMVCRHVATCAAHHACMFDVT
jgi:hypothetical protein